MNDYIVVGSSIFAVLIVLLLFLSQHRKGRIEIGDVSEALMSISPLAGELQSIATVVVQANEQRIREGRLTKEAAYSDAIDKVRAWLPVEIDATDDMIIDAINSAILVASALTNQIAWGKQIVGALKENGSTVDIGGLGMFRGDTDAGSGGGGAAPVPPRSMQPPGAKTGFVSELQ